MKNRIFLPPHQSLDLSFKYIHPQFITLASILPQNVQIPFNLKSFCETVYLLEDHEPPLQPSACQGVNKFEDVINQNIKQLLSMNKVSHIQCLAHTFKDYGLQLKNFNFGKTILETSQLKDLTEFVGIQFIKKLLYCYNIILKYEDSFFQVTGVPFSEQFGFKNFLQKKKKNVSKSIYNYTNETINRFQMLYCNHMNRNSGIFRKNIYFEQGIRKSMYFQEVKELSEKVVAQLFPSKVIKTLEELKQLQSNIYSLLTHARALFEQQKYAPKKVACKFDLYIARYCRLPKNYKEIKENVSKFIKNEYEGTPEQIFESMYSNNTSYDEIYQLLKCLLRKIVPETFLGKQNYEIFESMLKGFISMKRFQNYKIEDFLYRMDIFKIPWLRLNFNKKYKKQIIGRGRRVLASLITFLYNKFIIPVLKYNFFITQKHKEANKLFYYRKPLWILIQKLALKRFSDENLTPINEGKLNETRKNGIDYPEGKLRLMPKKGSFRPIITFNRKRKVEGDFYKATLNQILSDTQLVLRNLKNILGSDMGYCIFDNRQISHKYDAFVEKWRSEGCQKLVYFTLDIKKCYDSINTNKLVQIIQKTPYIQQIYLLVKYLRIYRNKKPLNEVKSIPYYFNFKERVHATSLENDPIRIYEQSDAAINIFPTKQKLLARDQIIKKLKQLCAGSIVSYKKQYWLQNWGIPQGLNVSGVLCSLYFSQLQKQFIDVREGLLMRLTDDYAYIGPEEQAVEILTGLLQCADANRFIFNADKINKNFHHPRLDKITKEEQFLWIGKKINIRTLEMSPAFQISSQKLAYAMNVNINKKHMKSFLKNKLKSLLTNHFSAYFKPHLFEFHVLVVNVRLYCKISLAKFFPFLISLHKLKIQNETALILKILQVTIHQFLIYACSFIQESQRHLLYHKFLFVVLQEFKQFFHQKRSFKFLRQIEFVFNARINKLREL